MNFSMFPETRASIQTLHINSKSKKAFNDLLKEGNPRALRQIEGYPDGTVIKFFTKYVGGNPYVTSYGTIKKGKIA
jgi:hypothetical protein